MTRPAPALLIASALTLAAMIPGGLVETRSFPDYPAVVLAGFNILLTGLGLGALIAGLRGARPGWAARVCGLGFTLVYVLDLARIFPVSPVPMSAVLRGLELLGTVLGLALLLVPTGRAGEADPESAARPLPRALWLGLALLAAGIVIFATRAALGR